MLNLVGSDAESNLAAEVNFDYYSIHEFHSSQFIKDSIAAESCFSVFHGNVRSLVANHDNLTTLLSDLNHNFNVIGISETKIMINKDPLANVSIPGYEFLSQPSLQNAGGVAFYIKNDIEFHLRQDLNSTTLAYECLWIKVHSKFRNIFSLLSGLQTPTW